MGACVSACVAGGGADGAGGRGARGGAPPPADGVVAGDGAHGASPERSPTPVGALPAPPEGSKGSKALTSAWRKAARRVAIPRRPTPFVLAAPQHGFRPPPPPPPPPPPKGAAVKFDDILAASARRVERHTTLTGEELLARLAAIEKALPRRDSAEADAAKARREAAAAVPDAPRRMFELMEKALKAQDRTWADAPELVDLLSEDVTYVTIDGDTTQGLEATREKMNEGLCRIFDRIKRASRHEEVAAKQAKMKAEGPTPGPNGTWVMTYRFTVMLLRFNVREEYTIDGDGKIIRLVRKRL